MTRDDGYATAAMAALSLALSLVVAAVVVRSAAEFRLATAAVRNLEGEYRLDAAQTRATLLVLHQSSAAPLAWSDDQDGEHFDFLAEPESPKLAADRAVEVLGLDRLKALGVRDAQALQLRLSSLAGEPSVFNRESSPAWQQCAPSIVSPFGGSSTVPHISFVPPARGNIIWHAGEVWRIRATDGRGWADDRIVRFTGMAARPAAIVDRRISRQSRTSIDCAAIVGEAPL
jgi:hypothetical protein